MAARKRDNAALLPPSEARALYRVVHGREPPVDFIERIYGRIEPPLFDRSSEREMMAYACLGALMTRLMLSERELRQRRRARSFRE